MTLRAASDQAGVLVLHPNGFVDISQKLVPLGIPIQRYGSTTPAAGSVFAISDIKIGGQPASVDATREEFAPAQFFEMSDAEKLSRPSFSEFDAGVAIGGDPLPHTDFMRQREVAYEVIYLPEHHTEQPRFGMPSLLGTFSASGAAVSRSPLSRARRSPSALSESDLVTVADDRFALVSTDDLSLHAADAVFDTAFEADHALKALLADHPELIGARQVVAAAELELVEA